MESEKNTMQRLGRGVVAAAIGACLGTLGWAADAGAAGFATQKFGGEQGNPVTTNPTALYYNPAGIAFSDGWHVYMDQQVAFRSLTYSHETAHGDPTSAPGDTGNNGNAKLFNVFAGPTLGFTAKFGDHVAIGAGLFVPFAGREHWSKNSQPTDPMYPLAADGVQRWSSISGSLTYLYATAGGALKFGPLSIGLTGNFVYSWVQFTKGEDLNGSNSPNAALEGRANLNVSGADASFGAGLMLEAWPKHLWLGASYQAAPGFYNANGVQTLKGTFDEGIPGTNNHIPTDKVNFVQSLPDIFRAGIRFRPVDAIELRAFGDYTRWSKLTSQCIAIQGNPCQVYPSGAPANNFVIANFVRDWGNTYGYRLGLSWYASPAVELFLGGGYEIGAVPDGTLDATVTDANNYQGAIGGRFLVANYLYVAASWTQIMYQSRDTTGKSVVSYYQYPTQQADGGGKYTQWIGLFDLNLEKQF
jgi:long-chain fatty acid transport protein